MFPRTNSLQRRRSIVIRLLRFLCVSLVLLSVLAPVPVSQAGSAAVVKLITAVRKSVLKQTTEPQSAPTTQAPEHTQVLRLTILVGDTRVVPLPAQLSPILVVSPEIAAAVLSGRGLAIQGLHVGETMVIGFDGARRTTFIIEVIGRTYATTHQDTTPADVADLDSGALYGSYVVSYSAPFGGAPTLLRQSFDFQKKLSPGRTLRFSSDMSKFTGRGDQYRSSATAFGLGLNRMSLGVDGPDGSVDILDSSLNISPLSFNGSTMRGFHLVSAPASPLRGMEFFAGQARPSLSLFDMSQGQVLGVVLPVAHGEFWRVRVGMFSISPGKNSSLSSGGTVWHVDGRYAPSQNLTAEAEVAYANSGISWRTRIDLIHGPLTAYGEVLRFDSGSPLVSLGAQGGGRQTEAFALQWRAGSRFNASFSFNHTAIAPPVNAGRASLDRSSLLANASFKINQKSRLDFRFAQQQLEIGTPGNASRFQLQTRAATIAHDIHFNKSLSNNFQVQLTASRETRANADTDSGFVVNDQLRYVFKRGSAVAFANYTRQKSSLAGLLVRNPTLLPSLLQPAFLADPVGFLQTNRDSLALLLPGVELPQTRGLDAGLRLQAAFSRITLATEARYNAGEILAREQRSIIASASVNLRLDAANSLQVSGSRAFGSMGAGGQTALTVSFAHRFGAGSGGGMQFSRLLGLERGQIQGRVFFDLNGNGQDDVNEPGVAGMKMQIGGERNTTTDARGRFHFDSNSGPYQVSLVSEELGVNWRASTMTEQHGLLAARQTVSLSFGINNYGSVAGRIFNDLAQTGEKTAGSLPGVAGVRLTLHSANAAVASVSLFVDGSGSYQFRNLSPGSYTLEIDTTTLPADFRVPAQTSWVVVVTPLQNSYLDLPLSAQRSIAGVVFIDRDGDGKFDPEKDLPVAGAHVLAGKTEGTTGNGGVYLLRNIPFGKIEVWATGPSGTKSVVSIVDLGEGPSRRKGVNLAVTR